MKPKIFIELVRSESSKNSKQHIEKAVDTWLHSNDLLDTHSSYKGEQIPAKFRSCLEEIVVCELSTSSLPQKFSPHDVDFVYNTYWLDESGPGMEETEGDEREDLPVASSHILPNREFHGLWDTLIYDIDIKEQLLSLVETTLLFSDKNVNNDIISWNSVVLLHGPPGTGKTSLCKALAQKLSIRFNGRYDYGLLLEINSHSLFSKWFSESGKLVQKLFTRINDMVADPRSLVCVLIDEVESLALSRQSASIGKEPGDAVRVVNALLTQLDQIKRHPNVLILTTSNITGTIDLAFVDRADIKQYIGLPSPRAIYQIYFSCIEELFRTNIISPKEYLVSVANISAIDGNTNSSLEDSQHLFAISERSVGLSGRTLRKLPMLAHAHYIRQPTANLSDFLDALDLAVVKFKKDEVQDKF